MNMRNQSGFTVIEMLMVILLVAILSAVAIPQFVDFRTEAKNAAVNAALGAMRTGISNQAAQMKLRCDAPTGTFPSLATLTNNDVVTGGDCTAAQVTTVAERKVVASPEIPANPWGPAQARTIASCVGAATGCNKGDNTACDGNAYTAASDGWCYNPATGDIWANTQNNGNATSLESTF